MPEEIDGVVILALSGAELLLGAIKTCVAKNRCGSCFSWVLLAVAILGEIGFLATINFFIIRGALLSPDSDLEWKLFVVAAGVDVVYFLLELFCCMFVARLRVGEDARLDKRARYVVLCAVIVMLLLATPMIVQFLRTPEGNFFQFTNLTEQRMVICLVVASAVTGFLAFCLTLPIFAVGNFELVMELPFFGALMFFSYIAPLLFSFGLSIYGAISGKNPLLFAMVLILAPPSASLSFAYVKALLLLSLCDAQDEGNA